MKLTAYSSKLKVILILSTFYFLLATSLCGCEAFRRKFVRKPKREKEIKVVVQTKEYEPEYSLEETYRKYFLFWRSWHEELVNALNEQDGNRKKQIFAAKKIIENLEQMRQLLLSEKQVRLDVFILEQKAIIEELDKHRLSHAQLLRIKSILKKQRKQIQEEFAFQRIEEYLVKE